MTVEISRNKQKRPDPKTAYAMLLRLRRTYSPDWRTIGRLMFGCNPLALSRE